MKIGIYDNDLLLGFRLAANQEATMVKSNDKAPLGSYP